MSKWVTLLVLFFIAPMLLASTVVSIQENRRFYRDGRTAVVSKVDKMVEETTVRKKMFSESTSKKLLATMRYVDETGKELSFQRYLDEDQVDTLRAGQKLSVQYLPGQWNSERFGKANGWPFLAVSALFFLIFVVVLRRPKADE